MSADELADRLTEEITLLSTKLVTAVSKQLELEEKLVFYHRENNALKTKLDGVGDFETKYNDLSAQFSELKSRFDEVSIQKNSIEEENKKLNVEVEELTASLFDEANKMVSNASRETYNFKVKNRKLIEEIEEKNVIIDSLQDQLVDLKKMFEDLEDENQEIKKDFKDTDDFHLNASVFAPKLKSIRLDLLNYNDFKEFLFTIMQPTFVFDLANLKLTKFFKRIWLEELEHSIPIPAANILTRWQKGKFFWSLLIDGKIKIEPIKGVNETLKVDYAGHEKNNIPIATKDICSFCEESRDDNLEHSRLHILKLLNPENIDPPVIGEYPLCNYCLIKIRNICDFFAKLRWYTKNGYKLPSDRRLDSLPVEEECKVVKMYLILLSIRAKIWWSKAGYWDNVNETTGINVEDMHMDDFLLLLNVEGLKQELKKEPENDHEEDSHEQKNIEPLSPETLTLQEPQFQGTSSPEALQQPTQAPNFETLGHMTHDHIKDEPLTDEFSDTRESFDEPALDRKNSQSKSFRKKVDTELDETLQMLKESMYEAT